MNLKLSKSWENVLLNELNKAYLKKLLENLSAKYLNSNCFPPEHMIFNAFNLCNLEDLKVVIIGQDPYHGLGQANGLCFSVNDDVQIPPSLLNIFKEIKNDLGIDIPTNGNLERWAKQGVLLLNSTLTVTEGKPNSHKSLGWEIFTDEVIKIIDQHKNNVVFVLWGAFAHKKEILIKNEGHLILKAVHPSPLSVYRGFIGCKHFSKTNEFLKSNNLKEIYW